MSFTSLETRAQNVVALVKDRGADATKSVESVLKDVRLEAINHVAEAMQRSAEQAMRAGRNADHDFFMTQSRYVRSLRNEA